MAKVEWHPGERCRFAKMPQIPQQTRLISASTPAQGLEAGFSACECLLAGPSFGTMVAGGQPPGGYPFTGPAIGSTNMRSDSLAIHTETPRCPVCSTDSPSYWMTALGHRLVMCSSCRTRYIHTYPEAVEKIYSQTYFSKQQSETAQQVPSQAGYVDYVADRRIYIANFKRFTSWILKFKRSGDWLDIGCAYGFLLECARSQGFSVKGLDIARDPVKWMEKHLNIPGYVCHIYDLPTFERFDIISAIEVIEHIRNPKKFLLEVYKRLNKDGLIVLATGNADSLVARFLGRSWWYVIPPSHCVYYTKSSLVRLLESSGFRVLDHKTVVYHVVGFHNTLLKLSRMLRLPAASKSAQCLQQIIPLLPNFPMPVPHGTTQFLIARKCQSLTAR